MTALEELFTTYNAKFTATAVEIAAWNPIDPFQTEDRLMEGRLGATVDNTVVTSVGLFGYDLTDFLDECATLEADEDCTVADYDAYTGWAVGVNWAGAAANAIDGVVFSESKWSVQVTWDEENTVESAVVDAVAEDAPSDTEAELEAATDGFDAWGADAAAGDDEEQFAFSFFEDDTDFYFEAEDTTSIWANSGARAGVAGNVETAEFVLVGAASLTAAASVIVASLLF